MADSPTQRARFRKQEVGQKTNAWGGDLNEDGGSDRIDEAINGIVAFALSDSKTLTSANYETDEARMRIINVTGGTGGTITIPAVEKWYLVRNAASGDITISNGSGSVVVVSGEVTCVFTNGTQVYSVNAKKYVDAAILNASLSADIPGQAGNAGKYLQTDGSMASWDAIHIDTDTTGFLPLTTRVSGVLPVANGGTGIAAFGTGVATFLETPSSANLAAAVTGETGTGALVFASSCALVTPDLGTPSAGVLTSCTGLPISTGVSGLGAGVAAFLATPSSANLITAVTNETGSGSLVFATSPTLVTPLLGTPTSGNLSNCTNIPVANATGTLLVANGGTGITAFGTGVATALGINVGGSGGLVTNTGTVTLTNKRITPRAVAYNSDSITPDLTTTDLVTVTGGRTNTAINAPTGTPTEGERLDFRFHVGSWSGTMTWNSVYQALTGATLPTSVAASKATWVFTRYNTQSAKWDVVDVKVQP